MRDDKWCVDATMGARDGAFCCCPIEFNPDGSIASVVTGLNFIGNPPGQLVCVIHEDGTDAVEAFCAEHKDGLRELFDANKAALAAKE